MPDGHIQKHLHSMFQLLRCEETLKMAVKLESARYGRTRYLVVVSCARKSNQRGLSTQLNQLMMINAQNNNENSEHGSHTMTNSTSSNNNNTINNRKSTAFSGLKSDELLNDMIGRNDSQSVNLAKAYVKTNILINECDVSASKRPQSHQEQTNQPDSQSDHEIEESCLLGIDCNEKTTVGLVLRILGDTAIRLDGDGGFCISGSGRTHIFKPVSVQAMWSALQTLHKVCAKARENKFYPGGPSHEWVAYYDERIHSDRSCLNEWNAMDAIESRRPPSPDAVRTKPTERTQTEEMIRTTLKEIIVQLDLDEVTSKYIRTRLEEHMDMNLTEYKSFIDQEMIRILGQMDAPTKIFDHVYLGSEWNASNLEELKRNGVRHILNVTREIDNFFPGMFNYFNVRVYDDEKTNLLKYWDNTFRYISQAKNEGSKVLVHCKMGVSRSASVVIAYAMKAYDLSFLEAIEHVKTNRNCIKPNKNFLSQLETYQGMLMAMKNKEKLQRSKSDTNLRNAKDARLLPGSEPTPLIQAFEAAAKRAGAQPFQNRVNICTSRPKSWSPDTLEANVLMSKLHSKSLENLPPERPTEEDEKDNVRVPCENGQSYSVSQNQVFHLDANHVRAVKLIVNELESNQKRSPDRSRYGSLKSTKMTCDRNDSLGVGGEFGARPLRRSESTKSRSGEGVGEGLTESDKRDFGLKKLNANPSFRHSAPDTERTFPGWANSLTAINASPNRPPSIIVSSNSSLAGDADPSDLISSSCDSPKNVKNLRNSFALREKKLDSAAVQRTNPKMDATKRSFAVDNDSEPSFVSATIARFADQSKDFIQCIKKRCKSEEALFEASDIMSSVNKRLSTSSPSERSPIIADKTPFLGRPAFTWSSSRASPAAKTVAKVVKARLAKNRSACGTVENLKLNFESRDGEKSDAEKFVAKETKRGNSLPSSPVAPFHLNPTIVEITPPRGALEKAGCEEISVKGLVDRYEVSQLKNELPTTNPPIVSASSPIFSSFNAQLRRAQNRLTNVSAHDNSKTNIIHPKPPPFPHSPTVVPKQSVVMAKRMPHENSQSFASLRQHFSSTSAYNTM